ncbi:MAG: copper resistance protein NlpE N-terminal domain-containing protein [Flavobacteriales bacterium]
MKHFAYLFLVGALLASCATPETSADKGGADSTQVAADTVAMVTSWPGYYTGALPCADCPGIETTLWVRSDSTFVLQQRYGDSDSIPTGTIGQWHVVNNMLTIGQDGDKPDFWRSTAKGIEEVDEMGQPFEGDLNYTLEKLADEIGDAIPRMRLAGTFTYVADAQSFQPCRSHYTWPCAAGMDMGEEEGEPLVKFTNVELQQAYRKGVKKAGDPWVVEVMCTMGMGPAMEGDGADEYLYLEQVLRTLESCP